MAKKDYTNWDRKELIKEIDQLRKRKRYGLVWEAKPENVVEQCKTELPVLEEVEDKEIKTDPDKPINLLIEGDNYHALSVLNYTHKGKIDIIYIDPPYNTGARDWKYNNDYVDNNDMFRHSKWIAMMEKRLKLAKNLLRPDGILIVTIDDNEFCSLGLLLDELFPKKIRTTVVIKYNPAGTARSGFSRCHEYAIYLLNPGQEINKKPAPEDVRSRNLRRNGNNSNREDSPTMFYPIYIDKKTLKVIGAGDVPKADFHINQQTIECKNHYEVWPLGDDGKEKNWYYSRKRVVENGKMELECKWVKEKLNPYFYTSNNSEQKYQTVWTGSEYDAGAYGSNMVKKLIDAQFPFPKSLYAVQDCIRAVLNRKDAIILDFFAGSGTTGHAVMSLNKENNALCKFILCTNNEINGQEKSLRNSGLSEDEILEHGICRAITYPRIKAVIKDGKDSEASQGNLKYFRTAFVPAEPTDKNKTALTKKATDMLCIKEDTFEKVKSNEQYVIFGNKKRYIGIIYDHQAIDVFKKEISKIDGKFSVYIFSLGDDTFDEEFEDMKSKVKLSPIPEAILRVYRRIFK